MGQWSSCTRRSVPAAVRASLPSRFSSASVKVKRLSTTVLDVDSTAWSSVILVLVWKWESGYGSSLIEDEGGCCVGSELPWVYGREK